MKIFGTEVPKQTVYAIIGGTIAVGGLTVLVVGRAKKKKQIRTIENIIKEGIGAYGGLKDIQEDNAFKSDYWKTSGSKDLLNNQKIMEFSKKIYDSIGTFNDNETDIVNIFRNQFKNKAQVSQVADYFQKKYSRDLSDFIASHVDKGTNPDDIQQAVKNLPKK